VALMVLEEIVLVSVVFEVLAQFFPLFFEMGW
jgi:hypothetical protein